MHYELIVEHTILKATNRDEAVEEAMACCAKYGRESVEMIDGKCTGGWIIGYWA